MAGYRIKDIKDEWSGEEKSSKTQTKTTPDSEQKREEVEELKEETSEKTNQDEYIEELEKLANLKDKGIITEDEYQKKKEEILFGE